MLGDEALRSVLKTALVRSLVYALALSSSLLLPPSSCSVSLLTPFLSPFPSPFFFSSSLLAFSFLSFLFHPPIPKKTVCKPEPNQSTPWPWHLILYLVMAKINPRHRVTPKVSIKAIGQAREWLYQKHMNSFEGGHSHIISKEMAWFTSPPKEWGSLLFTPSDSCGERVCLYKQITGIVEIMEIKIGGVKTYYFREWNKNKPKAHKTDNETSLDWESEQKTANRKWTNTSTKTLNTNTGLPLKHLLWNGWCCTLGAVFLSRHVNHVNTSLFVFTRWDPECCRQTLSRSGPPQ